MIQRAAISFPSVRLQKLQLLVPAVYLLLFLTTLKTYLLWQTGNFLLGLIALPMVIQCEKTGKQYYRYGLLALLFGVLCFWLPVKTLFYFAFVCAVFYMVESFYGRLNHLPFFVAVFMSPVFQYFSNIFSFPIRLQITEWAGSLLSFVGVNTRIEGNLIHFNGNEFSVDPACMGINMTVTSLLLGLMLIAFYQKRTGKRIHLIYTASLLGAMMGLNIFSNLIRILCLVQFNILPDTFMHELTGILCLFVYVMVPSNILVKYVVRRFGRPADQTKFSNDRTGLHYLLHSIILIVFIGAAVSIGRNDKYEALTLGPIPSVNGYDAKRVDWSIVKLENGNSLIYIKAIRDFYYADHNPMICWRGSGYELRQVKTVEVGNQKVYSAVLVKENERLYTAWWYDNGYHRTIDQFKWRWNVLKGKSKYSLVNITAAKPEELEKEIQKVQGDNRLNVLL